LTAKGLGKLASEFIGTALLFREAPEEHRLDPSTLRGHLLAHLDAFMRHPIAQSIPEEAEEARFALAALADEMIIVSNWSYKEQWSKDSLQLALYQTNRAGDEFYDHLAKLRPDQNQAREVYYLCLASGFEGQYAGRGAERVELMRQQYEMLRVAHRTLEIATARLIAPPAYDGIEIKVHASSGRRLWPVLAGWMATVALCFGAAWITLYLIAGRVPLPPEFLR
jgi:type IV/VI secretion system ImpK/VasF family protein